MKTTKYPGTSRSSRLGAGLVNPVLSSVIALSLLLSACTQASPAVETPQPAATSTVPVLSASSTPDKPVYKDASAPVEARVEDLLSRMTLEEKIGQMTQIEKNSLAAGDVERYLLGSVLSGGGGYPARNAPEDWAEMIDGYQREALSTRLGIPILYGVDAVHGHNNLRGATIFPHNIGLGATRDPDLVYRIGRATALEMIATGAYWNFAPVVAVPQDIRWGRTYEGYSENTELVTELALAYMAGLQGESLADAHSVLATPKHFVGDGGAMWGTATTNNYKIDQGVTDIDEATLRAVHLPPYQVAVEAGAMSIMVSYSSWGGMKMHAQQYLITEVLKGELGFQGFVVSDWAGIDQISSDYRQAVATAINAGVDMNMVPYNTERFIRALREAVEGGEVPVERIDDAVRRILRVKFALGLFEHPFSDPSLLEAVGSYEHLDLAREAVAKSLVLLKNESEVLPLAKDVPLIFVAGMGADDIGIQSGGWTISWQGSQGSITPGETILEGIQAVVSEETQVQFNRFGRFENFLDEAGNPMVAPVGIAVVGEMPYAEGQGDRADLSLNSSDLAMLERLRAQCEKMVVIVISGRPLVLTDQLPQMDALVAAWLPGSEASAAAEVLFGDRPFQGVLPFSWPRTMDGVPLDSSGESPDVLFPFGYGLTK
jgi:beta-glucosidase